MAMATRKDTRQYITRKGTFGADEMTDLTEGHDGLILQLEQDYDRPLSDAIVPLGNTPISSNIDQYMALVENDLDRNLSLSPSARGIVTKATAFEVQAVQQYTESEFGMHGSIKDEWLTSLLHSLVVSTQLLMNKPRRNLIVTVISVLVFFVFSHYRSSLLFTNGFRCAT